MERESAFDILIFSRKTLDSYVETSIDSACAEQGARAEDLALRERDSALQFLDVYFTKTPVRECRNCREDRRG